MSEVKLRRRKPSELFETLKAAALHYGSLALSGDHKSIEEAERKLKVLALALYQALKNEEEDKALTTLITLNSSPEDLAGAANDDSAQLGFAAEKDDLETW